MTPQPSVMEFVFGSRWVRDPWKRRGALAAAMLVLAVLSVWPRHYVARTEMLPNDVGNTLSRPFSVRPPAPRVGCWRSATSSAITRRPSNPT